MIYKHQKSTTQPLNIKTKAKNTKTKKTDNTSSIKSTPNNTKSKRSSDTQMQHQKYNYSDLKRTIIIDNFGNNNLNLPRKKMKSNITKMNQILFENLPEDKPILNSSLFENSTSTIKDEENKDVCGFSNFIVFDEKNRNEIDNVSILSNEEDEKNDKVVLQTSLIELDNNSFIEEETKHNDCKNYNYIINVSLAADD